MTKLTLQDVANLQNESTVVTALKSNNDATELAMEGTLSRDGTAPNQLIAPLDMNSNRIVNLPAPVSTSEPLRLQDLILFTGGSLTFNALPVGGSTGQFLIKNSGTNYDAVWGNKWLVDNTNGRLSGGLNTNNNSVTLQLNSAATSLGSFQMSTNDSHFITMSPSASSGALNGIVQSGDNVLLFTGGSPNTGAFVLAPWVSGTSGFRMNGNGKTTFAPSSTTTAPLNLTNGIAPSSPANGDLWFDGTNFKCQIAGVTKTFTVT